MYASAHGIVLIWVLFTTSEAVPSSAARSLTRRNEVSDLDEFHRYRVMVDKCGHDCIDGWYEEEEWFDHDFGDAQDPRNLWECLKACEREYAMPPQPVSEQDRNILQGAVDTDYKRCVEEGKLSRTQCREETSRAGFTPSKDTWYMEVLPSAKDGLLRLQRGGLKPNTNFGTKTPLRQPAIRLRKPF